MPDISMCKGEFEHDTELKCPIRGFCYRHTATPNPYRQSYFLGMPSQGCQPLSAILKGRCSEFSPNEQKLTDAKRRVSVRINFDPDAPEPQRDLL